jgi:hypothetical protein
MFPLSVLWWNPETKLQVKKHQNLENQFTLFYFIEIQKLCEEVKT